MKRNHLGIARLSAFNADRNVILQGIGGAPTVYLRPKSLGECLLC